MKVISGHIFFGTIKAKSGGVNVCVSEDCTLLNHPCNFTSNWCTKLMMPQRFFLDTFTSRIPWIITSWTRKYRLVLKCYTCIIYITVTGVNLYTFQVSYYTHTHAHKHTCASLFCPAENSVSVFCAITGLHHWNAEPLWGQIWLT